MSRGVDGVEAEHGVLRGCGLDEVQGRDALPVGPEGSLRRKNSVLHST